MGLLDELTASGEPPAGTPPPVAVQLDQHPGLREEIEACRAAGYSWGQIAGILHRTHQISVSAQRLSDIIEGRR